MDKEALIKRFDELVQEGEQFVESIKSSNVLDDSATTKNQAWLSSAFNLLTLIPLKNNHYIKEFERIRVDFFVGRRTHNEVNWLKIQKILGLLLSAKNELDKGLLTKVEYIIIAQTFDDFLDHAQLYHKAGKKMEGGVLASAVLEDTVSKIAKKNNIDPAKNLDPLIDDLVKADVIKLGRGKMIKAYADTRNHALHAEWEMFDIKDVGKMINGTRELIEDFL